MTRFAEAAGVKPATYRAYERPPESSKSIPLRYAQAVRWADLLDVRWQWLLDGEGLPWKEVSEKTPGEEVRSIVDAQSPEDQERIVAVVRALTKTGTSG